MNEPFKNVTKYIDFIGKGTQAKVYLHEHLTTKKYVAVKVYKSILSISVPILCELNALQRLKNCSHIMQLYDVDAKIQTASTGSYLSFKLLTTYHDMDMTTFIENNDHITRIQLLPTLLNQALIAMTHLYHVGIIHSDIKPDNILIDMNNNNNIQLYIADFGFAIQLPCNVMARHVKHMVLRGSPLYLAPELLTGQKYFTTKVDIWALGITFVQYLVKDYFTQPDNVLLNQYEDFTSIIFKILSLLNEPRKDTKQNYDLIEKNGIDDTINVEDLFLHHLPNDYFKIPKNMVDLITSMLQVNPDKRPDIIDLISTSTVVPSCTPLDIINRGDLKSTSKIKLSYFYIIVHDIINTCKELNLNPTTCYLTIDLLERYLHQYDLKRVDAIYVLSAALLSLLTKLYEGVNLKADHLIAYFHKQFNESLLYITILQILNKFNYRITTCETDDVIYVLNQFVDDEVNTISVKYQNVDIYKFVEHDILYPKLFKTYQLMEADGVFSGELDSFDWVDYFRKAII
ncbi:MAG TPA: protein kinase [Candidatus Saccharimonadales bacterium]|nr:protein kinase [Candidatus Saccharimonadales bacterium]